MGCAIYATAGLDRAGCFHPADSCGRGQFVRMAQAAISVQQGAASETDAFGDGGTGDLPIPGFDNFSGRQAVGQFIEDLPDHDAGAFERRLAVADQRIGDDVFAEFEAFGLAVRSCLHIASVDCGLTECALQARRKKRGLSIAEM